MYLAAEYEWQREVRKSRRLHCLAHAASVTGSAARTPTGSVGPTVRGDGSGITQICEGTNQIQRME